MKRIVTLSTRNLKDTANLSTGGTASDVTDIIHPDTALMAERSARAIGSGVGGTGVVTTATSGAIG